MMSIKPEQLISLLWLRCPYCKRSPNIPAEELVEIYRHLIFDDDDDFGYHSRVHCRQCLCSFLITCSSKQPEKITFGVIANPVFLKMTDEQRELLGVKFRRFKKENK